MSKHTPSCEIGWRAYLETLRLFKTTKEAYTTLGCRKRMLYCWRDGASPSAFFLARLHYVGADIIWILTGKQSKEAKMLEPWREEEIRQKRWDDWLKTRPECSCCGHPIITNTLTVLDNKLYCPECVTNNTYFVEDLEC